MPVDKMTARFHSTCPYCDTTCCVTYTVDEATKDAEEKTPRLVRYTCCQLQKTAGPSPMFKFARFERTGFGFQQAAIHAATAGVEVMSKLFLEYGGLCQSCER